MKQKNIYISIIIFLVVFLFLFVWMRSRNNKSGLEKTQTTVSLQKKKEKNYMLKDYPSENVPLYKMKIVSSSKFFVNKDPSRYAGYFGSKVNYYNIVFETEATQKEFVSYYRSLMTEFNKDASSSNELIEGKIGKYKVSASHYGNNPKNYGYLQVYLPQSEYQDVNTYFQDYPHIIDAGSPLLEYESSYGLLNQKKGEVEYTQYFPLPKAENDREKLISSYKEKYQNKLNYTFNADTGLMKWNEGDYSVSVTISKNHGRVYLMIRTPMLED